MTTQPKQQDAASIRSHVRDRYAKIAADFQSESDAGCCSPSAGQAALTSVSKMYETPEAAALPGEVTGLSLGCGDPIALASLQPGQTVLDLGSGGGIDCFLAAGKVGPSGHVIGVDMTPEMLEQARANKVRVGAENVEFRLGEIEHLPVPDASVDVIISNCVINLSPDKAQVFREAFRALKPGGRLAVSDIVTDGPLPEAVKSSLSAWAGCIAGALDARDYVAAIEAAGFVEVEVTPVYFDQTQIEEAIEQLDLGDAVVPGDESVSKSVYSARVTARKPHFPKLRNSSGNYSA